MSTAAPRHLVFIVNPHSGTDRIKAVEQTIRAGLDPERYSFELQYTRYAKHGTELARSAAIAGAFAVIAVGGDGSVNDVAAGLLDTDTALGILPKGSGNGLARALGIPLEDAAAVAVINRGNSVRIDTGTADGRLFLSNAGVGFDALIARAFATSKRRGLRAYSWLVAKHLWRYRNTRCQLVLDGKELEEKAFLINVANGEQFGYNFRIASGASFTDGWLDVVVIRPFPRALGAALVLRAMTGSLLNSSYVQHYQAKNIVISGNGLELLQTDGDAHPCSGTVRIGIEPASLSVLMP